MKKATGSTKKKSIKLSKTQAEIVYRALEHYYCAGDFPGESAGYSRKVDKLCQRFYELK